MPASTAAPAPSPLNPVSTKSAKSGKKVAKSGKKKIYTGFGYNACFWGKICQVRYIASTKPVTKGIFLLYRLDTGKPSVLDMLQT